MKVSALEYLMKWVLISFLIGSYGNLAFAYSDSGSTSKNEDYFYSFNYYAKAYDEFQAGKELSFESLKTLIHNQNIRSIPSLLKALKDKNPELMDQYLLAYRSRSLQESSIDNPRVILIADRARLNLAFNGNPSHSGYNSLEVMEYKPKERAFEFREISFSENSEPHFSQVNPAKCLQCHQGGNRRGVDPRPNWEPYTFWPGFFSSTGSIDPSKSVFSGDLRFIRDEDKFLVEEILSEEGNLKNFEKNIKMSHDRYKHLGTFNERGPKSYTENLAFLSGHRMMRLIESSPVFETYKWALFSALKCSIIAWPQEVEEAHLTRRDLIQTKRMARRIYDLKKGEREFAEYSLKSSSSQRLSVSHIITAIFEPLGISTMDWSMDFRTEGGRYAFAERFGTPTLPNQSIKRIADMTWPEMQSMNCDEIKEKALNTNYEEALSRITPMPTEKQLVQKVVGRCLSCHHKSEISWSMAPEIPFNSPDGLKQLIKKSGMSREEFYQKVEYNTGATVTQRMQMPPGESLSKGERAALLAYLKEALSD